MRLQPSQRLEGLADYQIRRWPSLGPDPLFLLVIGRSRLAITAPE